MSFIEATYYRLNEEGLKEPLYVEIWGYTTPQDHLAFRFDVESNGNDFITVLSSPDTKRYKSCFYDLFTYIRQNRLYKHKFDKDQDFLDVVEMIQIIEALLDHRDGIYSDRMTEFIYKPSPLIIQQ